MKNGKDILQWPFWCISNMLFRVEVCSLSWLRDTTNISFLQCIIDYLSFVCRSAVVHEIKSPRKSLKKCYRTSWLWHCVVMPSTEYAQHCTSIQNVATPYYVSLILQKREQKPNVGQPEKIVYLNYTIINKFKSSCGFLSGITSFISFTIVIIEL